MRDTYVAINSIFQQNSNTLLDQDILRFSLVITKDRTPDQINKDSPNFTHRDIAKWLIKNNSGFITLYEGKNKTDSEKIENTQRRVKDRLKELEQLGLIKHGKTKQQKGAAEIPVFAFSQYGYVVAWIIESFSPDYRDKANNEIYNWFEIIFRVDEYSPSVIIFYAHFFKRCKEKGQFEYIVSLFRSILRSTTRLTNPFDLFNEVLFRIFNYPVTTDPFHITLNETLNELDVNTKELLLYYNKLELERRMKLLAKHPQGFEDVRFRSRGNPHIVTVESYCTLCKVYFSLGLDLLDYRERTLDAKNQRSHCITTSCPRCENPSLLIYNPSILIE
ncbi:MAG: hypothetical protein WBF33_23505 [Candidatus Nitrosopolaris sp.]